MMKKNLIAWVLLFAMVLSLVGCGSEAKTEATTFATEATQEPVLLDGAHLELLSAMTRETREQKAADEALSGSMTDFALSLLQNSYVPGENTVLSPYSVYMALAMTANGARGETLGQIEGLLGMSLEELNPYALYLQTNAGNELAEANSLWFRDSMTIEDTFLQDLKNYYEAQVYAAPFDDSTLEAMNTWIREETKDRIPQALDQMSPNAALYLINALAFDGKWAEIYTTMDIREQTFYSPVGEQSVEMMSSTEYLYLNDGSATGFMKDYAGGRYSFLALLPNEGISLEAYLSTLTGERLLGTIAEAKQTPVIATMPKIQLETTVEMKDILTAMGMVDAFTMAADLSGMNGQQDLFISRILHKTYLQVDEAGTQAGAVTIEEIVTKGAALNQEYVFLNRPYIMGIYDKVNNCFLFLGTIENP